LVRGDIHVDTSSVFHGYEVNWRQNLCCSCCGRLDLLAGPRFLYLHECVKITDTEINTGNPNFPIGTRFDLTDRFDTHNQFWGGQLGLDGEYRRGCFFVNPYAKVAIGNTHQTVDISGNTVATVPGADPVHSQGALLALPSNIGHFTRDQFTWVPEFGLN